MSIDTSMKYTVIPALRYGREAVVTKLVSIACARSCALARIYIAMFRSYVFGIEMNFKVYVGGNSIVRGKSIAVVLRINVVCDNFRTCTRTTIYAS